MTVRADIYNYLSDGKAVDLQSIVKAVARKRNTVTGQLAKMCDLGDVVSVGEYGAKLYSLSPTANKPKPEKRTVCKFFSGTGHCETELASCRRYWHFDQLLMSVRARGMSA